MKFSVSFYTFIFLGAGHLDSPFFFFVIDFYFILTLHRFCLVRIYFVCSCFPVNSSISFFFSRIFFLSVNVLCVSNIFFSVNPSIYVLFVSNIFFVVVFRYIHRFIHRSCFELFCFPICGGLFIYTWGSNCTF